MSDLFTATFLAQESFRIDEYSRLAETVSALEAGPNGWVQLRIASAARSAHPPDWAGGRDLVAAPSGQR